MNERNAIYTCQISELVSWYNVACLESRKAAPSFVDESEISPTSEELVRELNWLLEDAVEGIQTDNDHWKSTTWHSVLSLGRSSSLVRLRASLEDQLVPLWRSRLEDRVPFQYIVASSHWRDLILAVQPGVLIPRPETEQLADLATQCVKDNPNLEGLPWLDLGTGSGALAISLAQLLPQSPEIIAVDLSPTAVALASHNVRRYKLQDRVNVLEGSWFSPLSERLKGKIGGILSNPPYIPSENLPNLQKEVGQHEPWLALDGGSGEGTDAIIAIGKEAAEWLCPEGVIIMEVTLICRLLQNIGNNIQLWEFSHCFNRPMAVFKLIGLQVGFKIWKGISFTKLVWKGTFLELIGT